MPAPINELIATRHHSPRCMAVRRRAQRDHFHLYTRCSTWTFVQQRRRRADQLAPPSTGCVGRSRSLPLTAPCRHRRCRAGPTRRAIRPPRPHDALRPRRSATAGECRCRSRDRRLRRRCGRPDWQIASPCMPVRRVGDIFAQQGVWPPPICSELLDDRGRTRRHCATSIPVRNSHSRTERRRSARACASTATTDARHATLHAARRHEYGSRPRHRASHARRARRVERSLFEAGDAGRHERRDGAQARQRVRLRHRLRAGPAPRRQLHRRSTTTSTREGERLHDGDIIAATFINRGKRYQRVPLHRQHRRIRCIYSGDGRPLRKAFLRTPVEFTRISSLFTVGAHASDSRHDARASWRRLRRADRHADPRRGRWQGRVPRLAECGYGNVVILQHGAHTTAPLYGHMSRIRRAANRASTCARARRSATSA